MKNNWSELNKPNASQKQNSNPSPVSSPDEELVHYDDQVIGKAFRWSLVALVALGLGAGGVVYYLKHHAAPMKTQITKIAAPVAPANVQAEIPVAKFTDITKSAGI